MQRKFKPELKGKVALEAIKGQKTFAEISSEYKVHSTQIAKWKKQLLNKLKDIFSNKGDQKLVEKEHALDELYKQIGQLKVENDFLKKTAYHF